VVRRPVDLSAADLAARSRDITIRGPMRFNLLAVLQFE
jgi:hypothetical protein